MPGELTQGLPDGGCLSRAPSWRTCLANLRRFRSPARAHMCSGSCGARVWPRISQNTHNTRVNGGACMRAFARTWCDCQFPRSLARPASHAALGSAFPRLRRRHSERTSPRSLAQSWRPRCDASVARSHRPSWRPGVLAVQTPAFGIASARRPPAEPRRRVVAARKLADAAPRDLPRCGCVADARWPSGPSHSAPSCSILP